MTRVYPYPCLALVGSRSGLRTVSSQSNIKAAANTATASGHTTASVSSRPIASSSSTPHLPDAPSDSLEIEKENKADNPTAGSLPQPKGPTPPPEGSGGVPVTTKPNDDVVKGHQDPTTPAAGATDEAKKQPPKSAAGKKRLGNLRRAGSPTPASSGMGVSSRKLGAAAMGASAARLGTAKRHGGGGSKGPAGGGETPERHAEKHAARNLEIFEQNLAGLSLPKGVAGKGAGGGRYGCFP